MRGFSAFTEDTTNALLALILPEILGGLSVEKGNTRIEPSVEMIGDGGRLQVNADHALEGRKAVVSGFIGYQWVDSFLKGIGGFSFGANATFNIGRLRLSIRMVTSPWSAISLKQFLMPWYASPYVVRTNAGGKVQLNVDNILRLGPLASVGGLAGYEWVGPSPSKGSAVPFIGGRLRLCLLGLPILFEVSVAPSLASFSVQSHEGDFPVESELEMIDDN